MISSSATRKVPPTLLDVQNPLQIRVGRALYLHPGATLRTPATHFRSIEGDGQIDVGSSYASVGIADTDSSFAGSITGSSAVAKVGSGLWTLTGTNTVPGKIELTEGTVSITGKLDALDVKVDGTGIATLAGTGTARDLALGPRSRISPGSGNGVDTLARLTVRNLRIVDPSAVARFDLAGSTVLTGHDQVRATDFVQLGGRLALFTTYTPTPGDRLRLIDKTSAGPITGTFENLSEAGTVTNQALIWKATYTGGDGNDFVLEFVGTTNPPPNLPPVLNSPATLQLTEGVPASLQVSATDPNPGQTLRFRIAGPVPEGLTIHPVTGRIRWTPTDAQVGVHLLRIAVTDDGSPALEDLGRFQITVQPAAVVVRLQAILDTTAAPPEVQISWPAAATDFELQFNPDPTNDAGWQPIANPGTILTEGNRRLFRPPAGANARFYRLHRPPPTGN